jgi:hypothetical protein
MTRPVIRILLPSQSGMDAYQVDASNPRRVRIYRSPPRNSPSIVSNTSRAPSTAAAPAVSTRTRPCGGREDRRWHDSRSSGGSSSSKYGSSASTYATSPSRPSTHRDRHHETYERPRISSYHYPKSAAYPYYYQQQELCPPLRSPPTPSTLFTVASSSSTPSAPRRESTSSTSSSDYLYGEDFAYGAEPLRPRSSSSISSGAEDCPAVSEASTPVQERRRRVRFVVH